MIMEQSKVDRRRPYNGPLAQIWNLKPASIIEQFDLAKPRYRKTAAYGHFGRN